MSPRQRVVLIALGLAVVAAFSVSLVIGVRRRRSGHVSTTASSVDTAATSTSTLVSLAPVPTVPPTSPAVRPSTTTSPPPVLVKGTPLTTVPPSTTATTAPATTTTTAAPTVTGAGAVLTAPATASTRRLGTKGDCKALVDTGFTGSCGPAAAKGGTLYWVVESKATTGAWRAYVFRPAGANTAAMALQAIDDDGSDFATVKAAVVDLAGDGNQDIVFGFHLQGSGAILSTDVVEGPGSVTMHREYAKGSVRLAPGQLDGWGAAPAAAGGGSFTHETIRKVAGAWRVVASVPARASDVPPSAV